MNRIRVIILVLLFCVSAKIDAQNIYLLSVGVADYPGEKNDLFLPAQDAQVMYDLYKKNASATSVMLTNTDAKKSRIKSEAQKLFGKAKQNDIVVLFFSGHGYKGGFVAYDGFLTYEEIRQLFAGCKARNKMIFADACFSGDIRDNSGGGFSDSKNSIMLFLSSRSNEYSIESPRLRNGFFATCLLRSLKGGADVNKDRIITAKELFNAVSVGVKRLSNNRQHPVMWGNFDDNMPVMIWK